MMKQILYILILLSLTNSGCKKYLDQKSDKTLVIPATIADAQALMDNTNNLMTSFVGDAAICDDNYWVTDTYLNSRDINTRNEYLWDANSMIPANEWKGCYLIILTSNTALETLNKIVPSEDQIDAYNLAKGMALMYRAFAHHSLIINVCLQYTPSTGKTTLGIPYKKTSDINDPSKRPSLMENFNDLVVDLKQAAQLLPLSTNYSTRPSKAAAFAALARVYMSMADYGNALTYSDSCLAIRNILLDYNTVDANSNTPFSRFNVEDLFHTLAYSSGMTIYPNWNCDSTLYNSYEAEDLRKFCFFRKNNNGLNTYSFKGTYDQGYSNYIGLATDEVYLTQAECNARAGKYSEALDELNTLLMSRYQVNTFKPYISSDVPDVLGLILQERRKELVGRGNLRWMDLKRLNLEAKYAKTLTRTFQGQVYSLSVNDNRYALLLPQSVISISGIIQNSR